MSTVAAEQALAQDPSKRGAALLNIPEDQWFDRKSARIQAKDLANSLIGFANADGGTVIIGLWDGGAEGIDSAAPKQLSAWQQAALDFTVPAVPCRHRLVDCINSDGEPDRLFILEVETSEQVHANQRDEVYLRVGDENRKLTYAQRQELTFDKGQASFESTPVEGAEFGGLDRELLDSYASAVNHPDPERLLGARGLLTGTNEITVAATLLFAGLLHD